MYEKNYYSDLVKKVNTEENVFLKVTTCNGDINLKSEVGYLIKESDCTVTALYGRNSPRAPMKTVPLCNVLAITECTVGNYKW